MPKARFSVQIDAEVETIWDLLMDRISNPGRYVPDVEQSEILERDEWSVLRRMTVAGNVLTERIHADPEELEFEFELVDHPMFFGSVINHITPPDEGVVDGRPVLTFELDWQPLDEGTPDAGNMEPAIRSAVLQLKEEAERRERKKKTGG